MSKEQFFEGLKRKVQSDEADEQARKVKQASAAKEKLGQFKPILQSYKAEVEAMGVRVEAYGLTDDSDEVQFKMYFNDGGYSGLRIRDNKVLGIFTDGGKHYVAEGSRFLWDSDFTTTKFEEELQREIHNFFITAPRHGGYK